MKNKTIVIIARQTEEGKRMERRALEKMKLSDQLTWNRKELAAVTGRSLEIVDKWIFEGAPCYKEGHTYVFERTSIIAWLHERAVNRTGMTRKGDIYTEIFPELNRTGGKNYEVQRHPGVGQR